MKVASLQHLPSIKMERITQLPPTVKRNRQILKCKKFSNRYKGSNYTLTIHLYFISEYESEYVNLSC